MEEEEQQQTTTQQRQQTQHQQQQRWRSSSLPLVLLNLTLISTGIIGGPLLARLYFTHGGSRRWLSSLLQSAAFPLLVLPLFFLHLRSRARVRAFPPKACAECALIGVLLGLDNFLYALGLSYLPVSTSSILFSTQLAFTALFARLIVGQRFTSFSINCVVLMVVGSAMLGVRADGDRPLGVSRGQYMVGFFATLGGAALLGVVIPASEMAFRRLSGGRVASPASVLQFQLGVGASASAVCLIGMAINDDFKAIPREAREFGLGEHKYYMVLAVTAIVWQMALVGFLGLIFCTTSLFTGICGSFLLPFTEVGAVIAYHDKFSGEKGMSLVLCLWGLTSYFYGEWKESKALSKNDINHAVGDGDVTTIASI
ncbi:Purine permease 3 [Acorus gramineus]|uniref:Probable purine permease n=1 Tax=Acorus gramineus TaxID=55184 RepID=A0AAV9AEV0_ACOGR|nr:Purine permease 3 [Acorus gramineus]